MAGNKSSIKGDGYEREVAKYLSEVYQDNFMRAPGSGALIGGSNAHRKTIMTEGQIRTFKGDVIPPDHWVCFHCEAKFHKDFKFHMLFTESNKELDKWIQQVREAEEPGDFNIICMKFNYKGEWVCVENKHPFVTQNSLNYKDWVFCKKENFWTPHNIKLVESLSTKSE